jgi:hypothetical protein
MAGVWIVAGNESETLLPKSLGITRRSQGKLHTYRRMVGFVLIWLVEFRKHAFILGFQRKISSVIWEISFYTRFLE